MGPEPRRDGRINPSRRRADRLLVEVVDEAHKLGGQMQVQSLPLMPGAAFNHRSPERHHPFR